MRYICIGMIVCACVHGVIRIRSEVADLTVDGGLGAYYRFALIASEEIPAGREL